MASPPQGILFCFILQSFWLLNSAEIRQEKAPSPTPWPLQFHALLFQNFSGSLAFIDLWYDWPKGSNFNIIHHQLGSTTYDLEWTNGTSFLYDLQNKTCKTLHVSVGILRPDWLDHATYLGVESVDGFKCNVWSKADGFIKYYEDIETKQPVHWLFFTGRAIHVLTFEVGRVLEDEEWQAPAYCFGESGDAVTGLKSSTSILKYEQRWLQSMEMTAMV